VISTLTAKKSINYDYYKESAHPLSTIKSYLGLARYSRGETVDAFGDSLLRSISPQRELSGSHSGFSAYSTIVACLWDEVLPTSNRTPTHWIDAGYIQDRTFESILCLPVRLMLPDLSPQSAAIRIAGYLQAVAEQIPTPTWTSTQPIGLNFCERYTELMLKGLITGWAHERGLMERLRHTLSI
jgi:hypothetical protein